MDDGEESEYRQEGHHWATDALTLDEMRTISDAELVERYDAIMAYYRHTAAYAMEPDDFLDEFQRRAAEKQRQTLDRLNTRLQWFTIVATIAAVASVLLAVMDLLTR